MAFPSRAFLASRPHPAPQQEELRQRFEERLLRELRVLEGERVLLLDPDGQRFAWSLRRAAGPAGRVLWLAPGTAGGATGPECRPLEGEVLPLEDRERGSFDLAVARFHLGCDPDPRPRVRELCRAVRRGGRVVLVDDDLELLRLWPEPAGWSRTWAALLEGRRRRNLDPALGRRLGALLQVGGARLERNAFLFQGSCAGSPGFPGAVEGLISLVEEEREGLTAGGLLEAGALDVALRELSLWSRRPDAVLWYGVPLVEALRP